MESLGSTGGVKEQSAELQEQQSELTELEKKQAAEIFSQGVDRLFEEFADKVEYTRNSSGSEIYKLWLSDGGHFGNTRRRVAAGSLYPYSISVTINDQDGRRDKMITVNDPTISHMQYYMGPDADEVFCWITPPAREGYCHRNSMESSWSMQSSMLQPAKFYPGAKEVTNLTDQVARIFRGRL